MPMPVKKIVSRKVDFRRKTIEKNAVTLIKHFEPKTVFYNQKISVPTLPEVNVENKTEIIQAANLNKKLHQKVTTKISKLHSSPQRTPDTPNNPKKIPLEEINRPVPIQKPPVRNRIFSSKSKSCEEKSFEKNYTFPVKSKSFDVPRPEKPSFKRYKSLAKKSTTSLDSESSKLEKLNKLKSEITFNKFFHSTRAEGDGNNFNNNNERVQNIRKEVETLIASKYKDKQTQLAELTAEICAFRNDNVIVAYNLNDDEPKDNEEKNVERERTATPDVAVTNCTSCTNLLSDVSSCNESRASKSEHTKPITPLESTSEDSVSQKLERANLLINRVRQTLEEIKSKNKKDKNSQSTLSTTVSCDSVVDQQEITNQTFSPSSERPRTRRKEDLDDGKILEKFKTAPDVSLEDIEYDLLQDKLNTIIENSEPEESLKSKSDSEKKTFFENATNTEMCPYFDKSCQTLTNITNVTTKSFTQYVPCTRYVDYTNSKQTQTQQIQCSDHSSNVDYVSSVNAVNFQKCDKLCVQVLPQINITRNLEIEQPFVFFIDNEGETTILKKREKNNVGLFLVSFDQQCQEMSQRRTTVKTEEEAKIFDETQRCCDDDENDAHQNEIVDETNQSCDDHINDIHRDEIMDDSVERSENLEKDDCMCIKEKKQISNSEHLSISRNSPVNEKENDSQTLSKRSPKVSLRKTIESEKRKTETSMDLETSGSLSSKMDFFQSFQVIDLEETHDPGSLDEAAQILVHTVDPLVYKTFINPEGHTSKTSKKSNDEKSPKRDQKFGNELGLLVSKEVQCDLIGKSSEEPPVDRSNKDDLYETYSFSISQDSSETNSSQTESTFPKKSWSRQSSESLKTLKIIKDKLAKQHPETRHSSFLEELIEKVPTSEEINDDNPQPLVDGFISGLMSQPSETIEKARKTIKYSMSTIHQHLENNLIEEENSKSDDDEDDGNKNEDYTVNIMIPMYDGRRIGDIVNPLMIGKNGRYNDEENLFCHDIYDSGDKSSIAKKYPYRRKRRFAKPVNETSSPSSTLTTSSVTNKSLSDGEVKCKCTVSSGEIHPCRSTFSDTFQKIYRKGKIQKKRSYFSNWVTYYVNKDAVKMASTSSSNNKF